MVDGLPGVAVWGVGSHARRKTLPALKRCEAVRLAGLTTRDREALAEQARRFDCVAWETPEEMLASPLVQVVYLATPTGTHHEYGMEVLRADRHLWCEKALTDELNASEALVAEARFRDLALCEAFMYVHHPQFERIRTWLDDGRIGRLRSLTARFGFPHLNSDDIRYDPALGGGALLDAGVYPISAALELIAGEPDAVTAHVTSDPGYDVDTGGAALLRFPDGVDALLEWGFGLAYRNELEIWGVDGTIRAERAFSKSSTLAPGLRLEPQAGEAIDLEIEPADHFVRMFAAFAADLANPEAREQYRSGALAQARLVEAVRTASAVP